MKRSSAAMAQQQQQQRQALFFFLLFLSVAAQLPGNVLAHSNLMLPNVRYGPGRAQASLTAPCGSISYTSGNPPNTPGPNVVPPPFKRGEDFEITWFNGGHSSPAFDSFIAVSGPNATDFTSGASGYVDLGQLAHGSGWPATGLGSNVRKNYLSLPTSGMPDDRYSIQWKWGSWYSCMDIDVAGDCPATTRIDMDNRMLTDSLPLSQQVTLSGTTPTIVAARGNGTGSDVALVVTSTAGGNVALGTRANVCLPASTPYGTAGSYACEDLPADFVTQFWQIQGTGAATVELLDNTNCAAYAPASTSSSGSGVSSTSSSGSGLTSTSSTSSSGGSVTCGANEELVNSACVCKSGYKLSAQGVCESTESASAASTTGPALAAAIVVSCAVAHVQA